MTRERRKERKRKKKKKPTEKNHFALVGIRTHGLDLQSVALYPLDLGIQHIFMKLLLLSAQTTDYFTSFFNN